MSNYSKPVLAEETFYLTGNCYNSFTKKVIECKDIFYTRWNSEKKGPINHYGFYSEIEKNIDKSNSTYSLYSSLDCNCNISDIRINYYDLKKEAEYIDKTEFWKLFIQPVSGIGFIFLGASFTEVSVDYNTSKSSQTWGKIGQISCYLMGAANIILPFVVYFVDNDTQKAWKIYRNKSNMSMKITPTILVTENKIISNFSNKFIFTPGFNLAVIF